MEAIIVQSLCDIDSLNTALFSERPAINDKLVGALSFLVSKEDFVVVFESVHHVVGIQQSQLSCLSHALIAHHLQVGP